MKKGFKITFIILGTIISILSLSYLYLYLKSPIIELNGKKIVYIEAHENYKDEGLKEIAPKKEKSKKELIQISNNINNNRLGTYKVNYIYKHKKLTRQVVVVDKTSPSLVLKGRNIANVCSYDKYVEEGYTATDNYDGDITDKVKVLTKDNIKTYEVSDLSGNKITTTRTLIIKDTESPKINLSGGNNVTIYRGNAFIDTYEAIDNCDGNITNKVVKVGSVDTNKIGTYEIKYKVSDSFNNKTEETRKVLVKEKTMYSDSIIYLTFDDGPSLEVTPYILDVLKKYNIKATFFVINKNSNTDYLIKRAYDEGHTIGLHSYTHSYNIYASVSSYFDDLTKIEDKVISLTGESSKIIRFPGGTSNTISRNYSNGIMSALAKEVQNRGYSYFDWNVGSSDTVTKNSEQTL